MSQYNTFEALGYYLKAYKTAQMQLSQLRQQYQNEQRVRQAAVSMQQIITESSIFCPHCGLRLNINHQESQPAIEALKKFQQAQSDFDRRSRSM